MKNKVDSIVRLPPAEVDYLLSKLVTKEVPKGQHIITEGKIAGFICYVDKGTLRSYLTKNGKETNTEFFFEGSFASAFTSFLTGQRTSLNIQALENSTLSYISRSLLDELYARNPLWFALGKYIFEEEFVKKCKRETSFLQDDAKERYLALLRQYPLIETSIPLYHISSYLGVQPETLSRIRGEKMGEHRPLA